MEFIQSPQGLLCAHLDLSHERFLSSRQLDKVDVFVVDNFLANPAKTRSQALKMPFQHIKTSEGYSYSITNCDDRNKNDTLFSILKLIGENYYSSFSQSKFVCETEADELETKKKVWIHSDNWSWVGLLYLFPEKVARSGTAFFFDKNTGAICHEERSTTISSSNKSTDWEMHFRVENKWNRLCLFRPNNFHAPERYFGSNLQSGRLYQLTTFN